MSRQTTLLALLLAGLMSLALFMISYQVQDLESQLDAINRDIARDSRAMHVLQAEWAHLNDPERLRVLADRYLGLAPVATSQLGRVEDIPLKPLMQASEPLGGDQPQAAPAPGRAVPAAEEDPMAAIRRALALQARVAGGAQ